MQSLLQESCQEYLQEDKLRGLVQRYSEFINFPILMLTTRTKEKEVGGWVEDASFQKLGLVLGVHPQVRGCGLHHQLVHTARSGGELPLNLWLPSAFMPPQVPIEEEEKKADEAATKEEQEEGQGEGKKAEDAKEGETVEVEGEISRICRGFVISTDLQDAPAADCWLAMRLSRACCLSPLIQLPALPGPQMRTRMRRRSPRPRR